MNDLCHDSIGNKLFGFIFYRSHEPIVISVCGMWSADQDHRIVSEPIVSGSFLELGPARYVDRCWIRNFITTIGHFISNITIVKIHKLPGNIYWNMVCLVSTVCIFSITLITYTYIVKNGMSKPCCIVRKHCVRALNWPWRSSIGTHKWRRHTSHCDVINRYHQYDVFYSITTM